MSEYFLIFGVNDDQVP